VAKLERIVPPRRKQSQGSFQSIIFPSGVICPDLIGALPAVSLPIEGLGALLLPGRFLKKVLEMDLETTMPPSLHILVEGEGLPANVL
jgi:hypothetical protein